jgi:hypothetical protein
VDAIRSAVKAKGDPVAAVGELLRSLR